MRLSSPHPGRLAASDTACYWSAVQLIAAVLLLLLLLLLSKILPLPPLAIAESYGVGSRATAVARGCSKQRASSSRQPLGVRATRQQRHPHPTSRQRHHEEEGRSAEVTETEAAFGDCCNSRRRNRADRLCARIKVRVQSPVPGLQCQQVAPLPQQAGRRAARQAPSLLSPP
jgi:hypothetical protein